MNDEHVSWRGLSGSIYSYKVFGINTTFKPNQDGNYIFAKKVNGVWMAVYVGEGDLQSRTQDEEHKTCSINKGATHLHCHLNSDETSRKNEETDILGYNTEAYIPTGCNIKKGG